MRLNIREGRLLSITAASWGIFLMGSGLFMTTQIKPIIHTSYTLSVEERKIAQAQRKTNEIRVKDLEIEAANPLSVDVKDYLENLNTLTDQTIRALKLDTSLVNINQAGEYQYTVSYGKKKYLGKIIVKEKEMPSITLKNVEFQLGNVSFSNYAKDFIIEELTPEIYNTCSNPNFSQVDSLSTGIYNYTIICNGITYTGKITIVPQENIKITTPEVTEEEEEEWEEAWNLDNEDDDNPVVPTDNSLE